MTPALLATLRAAGEAATKGPWSVAHWDGGWQIDAPGVDDCIVEAGHGREGSICDAAFIAHARNHWDELLDEIERRNVGLRNAGELIASQAAEIEGYWEIIENNIPGYGEPANYVKRIERAGRDARLANKHRDERDALKDRLHNASSVCMRARELLIRYGNGTIRPEVGTGECIDDLTTLLASLEEGVSRG